MAANPLTYAELEAYCRRRHHDLSTWEGDVLMRLDNAVMSVWAERRNTDATPSQSNAEIPISDVARLKAMVKATAARTRLINEAKAQARAQRRST